MALKVSMLAVVLLMMVMVVVVADGTAPENSDADSKHPMPTLVKLKLDSKLKRLQREQEFWKRFRQFMSRKRVKDDGMNDDDAGKKGKTTTTKDDDDDNTGEVPDTNMADQTSNVDTEPRKKRSPLIRKARSANYYNYDSDERDESDDDDDDDDWTLYRRRLNPRHMGYGRRSHHQHHHQGRGHMGRRHGHYGYQTGRNDRYGSLGVRYGVSRYGNSWDRDSGYGYGYGYNNHDDDNSRDWDDVFGYDNSRDWDDVFGYDNSRDWDDVFGYNSRYRGGRHGYNSRGRYGRYGYDDSRDNDDQGYWFNL